MKIMVYPYGMEFTKCAVQGVTISFSLFCPSGKAEGAQILRYQGIAVNKLDASDCGRRIDRPRSKEEFMRRFFTWLEVFLISALPTLGWAWHDETHLAIAKAAGYEQWYHAAGADMAKIKAGDVEAKNHYAGNPLGSVVTARMVLEQVDRYNDSRDKNGHLYGAIIASVRKYQTSPRKGKYDRYHLAFCAHYVGDLSQPLHNTRYNDFNRKHHAATDGIIEDEVWDNLSLIEVYPIAIQSESDLAGEIARIANLSLQLGYRLEREGRLPTKREAYEQIGHSASLFRAILRLTVP